jgi:hypothetical protein
LQNPHLSQTGIAAKDNGLRCRLSARKGVIRFAAEFSLAAK